MQLPFRLKKRGRVLKISAILVPYTVSITCVATMLASPDDCVAFPDATFFIQKMHMV